MNKKSVGMVLILYAALAGIPGVLAYFQENNIIIQSDNVSCGSCHVDPSASISEKTNLTMNQKEVETSTFISNMAKTPEKCEYCHKYPDDLIPHVNGGNLCFNCHVTEFEHKKSLIKE